MLTARWDGTESLEPTQRLGGGTGDAGRLATRTGVGHEALEGSNPGRPQDWSYKRARGVSLTATGAE